MLSVCFSQQCFNDYLSFEIGNSDIPLLGRVRASLGTARQGQAELGAKRAVPQIEKLFVFSKGWLKGRMSVTPEAGTSRKKIRRFSSLDAYWTQTS